MSRAAAPELPVVMAGPGYESRQITWGTMHVARERCDVPLDLTDVFRPLPGGSCPCPHWGYVIRGKLTFRYPDHDLTVTAGDSYYAEPGHVPVVEADSEIVEFSPRDAYHELLAALSGSASRPPADPAPPVLD